MDANLILYAIQWRDKEDFKEKYDLFQSEEERNKVFKFLDNTDVICKVTLIIRVETERDNE